MVSSSLGVRFLPTVYCSETYLVMKNAFSQFLLDSDSSTPAIKGVVRRSCGSSGGRTSQSLHAVESASSDTHQKVSQGVGVAVLSLVETIK